MKLFVGYEADVLNGTAIWNVSARCSIETLLLFLYQF